MAKTTTKKTATKKKAVTTKKVKEDISATTVNAEELFESANVLDYIQEEEEETTVVEEVKEEPKVAIQKNNPSRKKFKRNDFCAMQWNGMEYEY